MTTAVIASLIVIAAVGGTLMAITPWLMRKNECFAVTIPQSAQKDPRIVVLKKRYTTRMIIVTAIFTGVAALSTRIAVDGSDVAFTLIYLISVLAPLLIGFVLMLRSRKSVMRIKNDERWARTATMQISVAQIGDENETPHAISLLWNLVYIPILIAFAAIPLLAYDTIPDVIPMNIDLSGNITNTAAKSIGVVLIPSLITLFIVICLVIAHASITFSKKYADPSSPATSAYAYGMFARAQSIMLLVGGVLMCISLGSTMLGAFLGLIDIKVAAAAILVSTMVLVAGSIIVSVVYGQAGSRLFSRMEDKDDIFFDDDKCWKLGIFYFNKEDSSVFLPERFGIGWTINLARLFSWVIIVGLAVLTVAFIAVLEMLIG